MDEPISVHKETFWLIEPKILRTLQLKDDIKMSTKSVGKNIEIQFDSPEDPKMALEMKAFVENLIEALTIIEAHEILPENMTPDFVERLFKGPLASRIEADLAELEHRVKIKKRLGKWQIVTAERYYAIHKELIKLIITERLELGDTDNQFVRSSPKWKRKQEEIERSKLVIITLLQNGYLRLEGYAVTVMETKEAIGQFLQQQEQVKQKIVLSEAILRLLKVHFQDELEEARDNCPSVKYKFKNPKPPTNKYIEVRGNTVDVEKFVSLVNRFLVTLCHTNIVRDKPGMSSFYAGSESSGQIWLRGLQEKHPITVETLVTSAFMTHQNNIKPRFLYGNVVLLLGNIAKHQSEVLVNIVISSSPDLSLCGDVAMEFLQAGGQDICADFKGLQEGQVEVSHNTATLACHLLIHMAVLEPWREKGSFKLLKTSLKECLRQTSQFKMKCVAFPFDGLRQCPSEDLATIVMKVALSHPAVQVQIIASSQDDMDNLDRAFGAVVKDLKLPESKPLGSQPTKTVDTYTGPTYTEDSHDDGDLLNISCETGDVTLSQADVLVNSVASTSADLSSCGEVAQAFAATGGQPFCDAFRSAGGVAEGTLWVHGGAMGNLQCQQLYTISISQWNQKNEEVYSRLIDECLRQASAAGFTSIHFPSFGCGNLSCPPEDMIRMLESAAKVYPTLNVKVFSKNEETLSRMRRVLNGDEPIGADYNHNVTNITVVHGNVVEIQADVLVNSVASDSADLSSCGEVAGYFLTAGGEELKQQYKVLGGVRHGQIRLTAGPVGAIHCQKILHMRVQSWNEGMETQISSLVQQCFQQVTSSGYSSVAFPTFGCGNLKYPPETVMKVLCTMAKQHPHIQVTIAAMDENLCKLLETICSEHCLRDVSDRFNLCVGNICDKQDEVAVCSVTSDSPRLSSCGEVAQSFARAGGKELVKQYTQLGGLPEGQIKSQPACGNLKCRFVIYVSIRKWNEATQQLLQTLFTECMRLADEHGLTTLGIPTLGCGGLSFPTSSIAQILCNSFGHSSRFKVTVVARQYKTYMAFQSHFQDLIGTPLDSHPETDSDVPTAEIGKVEGIASDRARTIYLVEGDLLQAQTDLIVVPVTSKNRSLEQCGLYCRDLHHRHAKPLRGKFKGNMKPGSIDTVDTPSSMFAQKIVFAALHDTWKGQDTAKLLSRVVKKCVGEVSRHSMASISFPCIDSEDQTYPAQDVARVLLETSQEFPNLMILLYVCAKNDAYATLRRSIKEMQNPSITFHITAKDHVSLQEAEAALGSHIDKQFSSKVLALEDTRLLPMEDCLALQSFSSPTVHISIDPKQDHIMIAGELAAVDQASKSALAVVARHKNRLQDPAFVKQHKGVDAFLRLLATQTIRTPNTWTKFKNLSSDDPLIGQTRKSTDCLVDCDPITQNNVKKFVKASWQGIGTITSVQKIENPDLYCKYAALRQQYIERACKSRFSQPSPEVSTASQPFVSERIPEVNEYFFFHGSKQQLQKAIITKGFDFRHSGNGNFGRAVYMAEAVEKSHQYSDGTMFIARGLVGEAYVTPSRQSYVKPPCRTSGCEDAACEHSTDYDSVIGKTNFREFMFYDRYLCYPEFLVKYTR